MNKPEPRVEIVSTGRYLPDREYTNDQMNEFVETSDEWIRDRTGIRARRISTKEESAAFMAAGASRQAMDRAGLEAEDVDLIVLSTVTPDRLLPSTSCDTQALLGATKAVAFDVSAACSGFLYCLSVAEGHLALGKGDVALVIATEKMSGILDWNDRSTCVLFGDGAGAAVVKRSENGRGILSSYSKSDGRLGDLLYRPAGGVSIPVDAAILESNDHMVRMQGREVFKNAVRSMAEAAEKALEMAGLTADDVDLLIPHQANLRIIESTARYSGVPMEKVYVNVDRYGNMSSASLPVALDEAVQDGRLQPGMTMLAVAFGAGFTWGATVFQW